MRGALADPVFGVITVLVIGLALMTTFRPRGVGGLAVLGVGVVALYSLSAPVVAYGLCRLDQLLAANRAPMTVQGLKDDLKELWRQCTRSDAETAWKGWPTRAVEIGIRPLVAFARKIEAYPLGILAYATWPLHTSLLEGINNKIQVIKRMAYGFGDDGYFFLKIRNAFPGIR